jgi:predicted metal-dependent hydrolase
VVPRRGALSVERLKLARRRNWRIIHAPAALVVAHEVVHLVHPDHGAAFWATLGAVMPDYEARRTRLRQMGRLLEW